MHHPRDAYSQGWIIQGCIIQGRIVQGRTVTAPAGRPKQGGNNKSLVFLWRVRRWHLFCAKTTQNARYLTLQNSCKLRKLNVLKCNTHCQKRMERKIYASTSIPMFYVGLKQIFRENLFGFSWNACKYFLEKNLVLVETSCGNMKIYLELINLVW
jgi:hypothetical protein